MKSYLLNSVAHFEVPNDNGAAAEAARTQKERDSIKVESIKIEDEPKEEDNEQKEEDGKEEAEENDSEEEGAEADVDNNKVDEEKEEEDKEALRAKRKQERIDRKLDKQREELKAKDKRIKELEDKLTADPEKGNRLTEEDVEAKSQQKAKEIRAKEKFDETADKLADGAQKHLKLTNKKFDSLIDTFREDVGEFPPIMIIALGKIKNGAETLAHLLQNHDDAEDIIKLAKDPVELALELNELATRIKPKQKAVSQVPDPVEPLGGKSKTLNNDINQKGLSDAEWVARRNVDVSNKRANGKHNLR